jgi:DNA polymerase-3 subunit delta'
MRFSEIIGQEDFKTKLTRSVKNSHVAHAMLIAGSEGGAGLQTALAFATYLNCENRSETDSCGQCASCHKMDKLIHPDLNFFYPVSVTKAVKKNPISELFITQWREFIASKPYGTWVDWGIQIEAENKQLLIPKEESRKILSISSMKSFEGEFKIILIWLPEYMNVSSANALLKVLEEPPAKTIFLLVTENPEKIIPTILSRTQVMRIPPYSKDEVQELLISNYSIDQEKAETISQIAQGNISEALRLTSEIGDSKHLMIRDWFLDCYKGDFESVVAKGEEFHKMGRESQKAFFRFALSLLRESLVMSGGAEQIVKVAKNQEDFIQKFSKTNGWQKISRISKEIDKAYYHLERNLYAKIVFLDTSLLITRIFRE